MTNGWVDIKNTDVMLIMGGNPAENHPCGFKWVVEAKKVRNAKLVVVDPRFQRTASQADHFCQIRAGSDIAFLGGLINYTIANNRIAGAGNLNIILGAINWTVDRDTQFNIPVRPIDRFSLSLSAGELGRLRRSLLFLLPGAALLLGIIVYWTRRR